MPSQGRGGPVGAADGEKVVEDRLEQVDRHDHVDVLEPPLRGGLLDLQRADADADRRAGPISAVPPQLGCAGAVKIASSSTYSQ